MLLIVGLTCQRSENSRKINQFLGSKSLDAVFFFSVTFGLHLRGQYVCVGGGGIMSGPKKCSHISLRSYSWGYLITHEGVIVGICKL
jgi:hypothetical protein